MIIDKLKGLITGELEMSATQVQAARILLNKALPDLKAVEHSGEISSKTLVEMTYGELITIASAGRAGAIETQGRVEPPAQLH